MNETQDINDKQRQHNALKNWERRQVSGRQRRRQQQSGARKPVNDGLTRSLRRAERLLAKSGETLTAAAKFYGTSDIIDQGRRQQDFDNYLGATNES